MGKLIALIIFLASCYGNSVTLFNDSPFKLKATILSATGDEMGSVFINPQHQITWQDSYSGGQSFSQTPYTVIWYCMQGREYGIWTNVSAGAFVSASASEGPRICPLEKKPAPNSPQTNPPQNY